MAKQEEVQASAQTSPVVTLTVEQLNAMVAAGVKAGLSQQPQQGTLDERVAAHRAEQRPKGESLEYVPCISRQPYGTGSAFLAVVSRKGLVLEMMHYTKPVGWENDLPDGMKLAHPNGQPNMMAQQHIWTTYYQRDLRMIIGKPLDPGFRMKREEIEALSFATLPVSGGSGVGSAPASEDAA